ncbi:uncharacterized protein [Atheta coriaria]|uniref:uncharacterized protein isoform X3 n=1 Tax=Dalotia coriaria TaxID=877792 RepID=UPI0031F43DA3
MGESEMKMDEQHAGSPTVRIEDKKSDPTAVSTDADTLEAKQTTSDAEELHDDDDDQVGEIMMNGDDELLHADDVEQQPEDLIDTNEVIEAESELEVELQADEIEEKSQHEEPIVDAAASKSSAGDSKCTDAELPHMDNKNVDDFDAAAETGHEEEPGGEGDVELDAGDDGSQGRVDVDEKCEDLEDDTDAIEDVDSTQQTEAVNSSILEDALKNGNNENPVTLNKMHMEDVREGCDTAQPSSPGHAELRSELTRDTESVCDDGQHQMQESFSAANSIKIEGDSDDEKCTKRKNQDDDDDVDEPTKKLKKEIQQETYLRNKILMEYTEGLDMSNLEQIQNEEDKLIMEIQNLDEIAKERERQWNNIIHVKKMKEELLLRIQRQKQVCMMTNGLEISDGESSNHQDATMNGQRSSLMPNKHSKQDAQNLARALQHNLDMNGHDPNKGRTKGAVRNVQSIIADYRQRHPEIVPRRGRRIRNVNGNSSDSSSASRAAFTSSGGSFTLANVALGSGAQVRPVDTNSEIALLLSSMENAQVKTDSRTTFSPTLARLLTAPDKTQGAHPNKSSNVSISDILSTNKARSEITITPVTGDYEEGRGKRKHNVEDETEDSVDRLVIDESNDLSESRTDNNSEAGDDVPQCQGCNQKAAQFVCAGCGNQWYCSRECQVTAWDEHSDVCSG